MKYKVYLERPKWSLEKAEKDWAIGSHERGYDWSKTDKKNLAIEADSEEEALQYAKEQEEAKLDREVAKKLRRREFPDLVAAEFWKREQRYIPVDVEQI